MKSKGILAILNGALALQSLSAGESCPPQPDKCPITSCDDAKGSISVGYDTDYLFYGIRVARDNVWGDVSYTFDGLPSATYDWRGQLSSLGSGPPAANAYGDP